MARVFLLVVLSFVLVVLLWGASAKLAARIRSVDLSWTMCFKFSACLFLLVVIGNALGAMAGRLVRHGDVALEVVWLVVLAGFSIWFFEGKGQMASGKTLDRAASLRLTLVLFGMWLALGLTLAVVAELVVA